MKCPLTLIAFAKGETVIRSGLMDCIQEECAWWVKASGSCAMEATPRVIGFLGSELQKIARELSLIRLPRK